MISDSDKGLVIVSPFFCAVIRPRVIALSRAVIAIET